MSTDARFLDLHEAAEYMGLTTRWMRRHWPDLVQKGVRIFRVPKNALKGRLLVDYKSLEAYLKSCQIEAGSEPF